MELATNWKNSKIIKTFIIVCMMCLVWQIVIKANHLCRLETDAELQLFRNNYEQASGTLQTAYSKLSQILDRTAYPNNYNIYDNRSTNEEYIEKLKLDLSTYIDKGIYYYYYNNKTGETLQNSDLNYDEIIAVSPKKYYDSYTTGKIAVGYDKNVWAELDGAYQKERAETMKELNAIIQFLIIWLLMLAWLAFITNKKINALDKIWTELHFAILFGCFMLSLLVFSFSFRQPEIKFSMFASIEILFLLALTLFLSIIRKLKAKQFWKLSASGAVFRHIVKTTRRVLNIDKLEMVTTDKLKAEKMKSELITNVSHDLKTPLTAIINYSDLLSKDLPNNEKVKIIHEKSLKLKELTEGLFEISRASSGNIDINLQEIHLSELINQTLAEIDSDIQFKVKVDDETIMADSKLIGSVFYNLVLNMAKYSLENTRAYIEVDGKTITFKNTANYEMNFDAQEICGRFARGDSSRTDGGSGLGLAIAQSYVEACGGAMRVEVDGDMFKVILQF